MAGLYVLAFLSTPPGFLLGALFFGLTYSVFTSDSFREWRDPIGYWRGVVEFKEMTIRILEQEVQLQEIEVRKKEALSPLEEDERKVLFRSEQTRNTDRRVEAHLMESEVRMYDRLQESLEEARRGLARAREKLSEVDR